MTTSEQFGHDLKAILKERGYTQTRLAKEIGVTLNAMNNIIKGHSFPPCKTLNAICEALDIEIKICPKE